MTEEFKIRAFEPQDESSVIELWHTVFPDDPPWNTPSTVIKRKLLVQSELFLVCVSFDLVAGTVLAGYDGVRGWVHKLAVHPDFQRRGLASQLMTAAEEGLLKMGCPKLNLQIRATNTNVIKFYENAGYSIEARVSMGKRLGPAYL